MKWLFKIESKDSSLKYKEYHSNKMKRLNLFKIPGIKIMNLSMIYSLITFLILIQFGFNFLSSKKAFSVFYVMSNEISLKIQGTGDQFIVNENYPLCPDEIYLNSDTTNLQSGGIKKVNIPEGTELNTIKLVFNGQITSLYQIFYGLVNLIEADLSNLDGSLVVNMQSMFYGSTSIKSIYFGNFNTSLVQLMDYMFYNCSSLIYVDLSKFNTRNAKTMSSMFYFCFELSSLDLSSFNTESVENMDNMFYHCISLTSLNLSNFHTPLLTSMNYIFESCVSLTFLDVSNFNIENVVSMNMAFFDLEKIESLDLSNFSTNKVTNMKLIFFKCYKLKYLNIKNFKTNMATDMESMFAHCSSLTSLDVSGFNTSNVVSVRSMFYNCTKLPMLNLSNFDTTSMTNIQEMFQFSDHIEYINFKEYKESAESNSNNILYGVRENIVICVKEGNNIDYLQGIIESKGCARIDCSDNWKDNQKKIIAENGTCIDDCSNFNFEIHGACYSTCPEDEDSCQPKTTVIDLETTNINNNNLGIETTNINNNNLGIETTNINNININIGSTNIDNNSIGEKENNNKIKVINVPGENNEEIYQGIVNNILTNYDEGENIIIEAKDNFTYHITNTDNEKDALNEKNNTNRLTKIDLGECENLLKNFYNIEKNVSLIIMKYEKITTISSERSLQYEVYEPIHKKKLNLSICDNTTIDLYIPLILSDDLEDLYNDLKEQGYDLFNIEDEFYQDICTPYKSSNGTDVSLADRVDYYYNNDETLCQSNCQFSNYSMETQLLKCECDTSNSEIDLKEVKKFTPKSIYESFYETLKFSNYKVLKCHNLAFALKSITSNKGGIMTIVYFCLYLVFLILFYVKGRKQLEIDFKLPMVKEKNLSKDELLKENNKGNPKKKDSNIVSSNQDNIQNITNKKKSKKKRKRKTKNENIIKELSASKEEFKEKRKTIQPNSRNIEIFSKKSSSDNVLIPYLKSDNKEIQKLNNEKKINLNNNTNLDNKETNQEVEKLDNYELNNLQYDMAIKLDKREFLDIYWSILKREHIIIFTFFIRNDYNIIYIKFARFIFLLCTDMALNVFFFADETMHKMFLDYGKYNFLQQIPQIIYSKIISQLIEVFLCYLSMTDKYFYLIKKIGKDSPDKILSILKCMKIKLLFFYLFTSIMFLFYWYTITCFCAVYENTQITFIKDSLSSFALGLLYPFALYTFPVGLRLIALRASSKLSCLYFISDIIPFF